MQRLGAGIGRGGMEQQAIAAAAGRAAGGEAEHLHRSVAQLELAGGEAGAQFGGRVRAAEQGEDAPHATIPLARSATPSRSIASRHSRWSARSCGLPWSGGVPRSP